MKRTLANYTVVAPKPQPSDHGSWWLGLDREQFYRQAAIEQERLSGSKAPKMIGVAFERRDLEF